MNWITDVIITIRGVIVQQNYQRTRSWKILILAFRRVLIRAILMFVSQKDKQLASNTQFRTVP